MATHPIAPAVPDPRNTPIASGKRAVQITASQVQPPTPLYLQPEDSFRLQTHMPTYLAPVQFFLMLRWLRPDGEITSIRKSFIMVGTQDQFTFALGEGFLLSATFAPGTAIPLDPGAVFFTLILERNAPDGSTFGWVLISDYMSGYHYPTWPFGRQIFSQEGPGRLRSIVGTTPAAGAEVSELVPTNVRWELIAFRISLATSAAVSNRKPSFIIDDGVNTLFQSDSNLTVTASNNGQVTLCNTGFVNAAITNAASIAPCPPFMLRGAWRIRTTTSAIDVADQYASPKYLVREWVDG
jgi:hypothetical protein